MNLTAVGVKEVEGVNELRPLGGELISDCAKGFLVFWGVNTTWGMAALPHFQITERIIESAVHVHRSLGPGLLESAYQRCLAHHLRKRGFRVDEGVPLNLTFEELSISGAYKIDMIVQKAVMLELKAVETLGAIHVAQAITYLKFSGLEAGLILNFNSIALREGLRRVFNNKKSP